MTIADATSELGGAAARDLRAAIRGDVVLPGDDTYELSRQIWNGAVDHRPALIVLCETQGDVKLAVRAARRYRLPLSVRGGGHDWAGRAIRHQGLVIDLSRMRQVDVNPLVQTATVMGGATANDLLAAAAPHGLAAVSGNVGSVGIVGLTLAGGYGPLSPRFGLALDNMLGADVVLADGRCITADAVEHPDLFWALCGGGGNFGVVTSMRVRLHPLREVLAGLILFPWSDARSVLSGYAEMAASAPDELSILAGVVTLEDGSPCVYLRPAWCGARKAGEQMIGRLQNIGTPLASTVASTTCAALAHMFDPHVVDGRHCAIQTRWLPALTSTAITDVIYSYCSRTSPFSTIALHHFHGQPSRVPLRATAFGLRRPHFLVETVAIWEPGIGESGTTHRRWAQSLSQALARDALPGGYPNLLGPDAHEQIAHAYGSNAGRLRAVKQLYDPDEVFSATPLPP